MKAIVDQVVTAEDDRNFGWINLKIIPETEEERDLLQRVGDNHAKLCDEESDEEIVVIGNCCTSPPIEMEIIFPKPSYAVVEK